MHWKLKAILQNAISCIPNGASYAVYYWIQKHFGGLLRVNPISRLTAGIKTWQRIQSQDCSPSNKVFLEIGTGRAPMVPLAYWLMGADRTITIDLNPYLKIELIAENLFFISQNEDMVLNIFDSLIDRKRFHELLVFAKDRTYSVQDFLDLCHIVYIAPGDAANTAFPEKYIDFHTSYTVLEHIPKDILFNILKEGNRLIKDNGLFVHCIDYSDHFSHSDKSITGINFLKYSDKKWARYAGNRYMYMNRLRHDDFLSLFESAGHSIIKTDLSIDLRSKELLISDHFHLSRRFSSKPKDILAISSACIVSKYNQNTQDSDEQ